ncbi:hypothetical protein FLL45_04890 [Aliikangiella marina]|uniref:Uncharacterized protein n=1 Tax=Aliikangiella marina TaxID=1712262 RepID=A0A545TJ91_9GAMM|nr:hypothetical protein [Aliikangiella marina]TQV77285.1 hypothetical protein FLL45_04890 [Aliikangiella marina]
MQSTSTGEQKAQLSPQLIKKLDAMRDTQSDDLMKAHREQPDQQEHREQPHQQEHREQPDQKEHREKGN